MAEYPTRQFSATNAYNAYMQALEDEEERKKAYNIVHNMYKLTNPHYAGSSAESSNLSKISKLGSGTSSGLATRLRLMTAADKENLGMEFTSAFQDWFIKNPTATLEKFNIWANKQGPWYSVELRKQHAAEVQRQAKETSRIAKEERDIKSFEDAQLKEDEKDAIQAAANALSNKYAGRFRNQGADIQQRLIADMQREIDDSELPSELKGSVFTETLKILKDAYGGYGEVQKTILEAEDKALQKKRAERKWKLGDRHPDKWWADTQAAKTFRDLMEATKDIETDFERAQEIQRLKREKLQELTITGINEEELDSLLASAGFPAQPFTSTQYNQLMERKQLIAAGRFEDAYQMYNREFSQDPAFMQWQANAREAGIYKIMSSLVPDWSENSRALLAEWESFRNAELLDEDGEQIAKAERDRKSMDKLEELAAKYKVSPRFIYWALTKNRKDVWGIGATVLVDI
jgi:hypothetical protein